MPALEQAPVRNEEDNSFRFDDIHEALQAFARGEFLMVMDDENRENEGDLIIAATHCTTEKMAWMIKHTRLVAINVRIIVTNCKKWLCLHISAVLTVEAASNPYDGRR